jgi:class 3 adenylate cyclase
MLTIFSDMRITAFDEQISATLIPRNENFNQSLRSYSNADTIIFEEDWAGYCVGFVDIVDSTRITARLPGSKMSRYYSIFLNFMGQAARDSGAVIVKNVGDSLLYYYPETFDAENNGSFIKCIDGNLRMIRLHKDINKILAEERLPRIDYRISCDYGQVILARSKHSVLDDIFGTTVNVCSRINGIANPNTVVIGGDLYSIVKDVNGYSFSEVSPFSLAFKFSYPVYSITHGRDRIIDG